MEKKERKVVIAYAVIGGRTIFGVFRSKAHAIRLEAEVNSMVSGADTSIIAFDPGFPPLRDKVGREWHLQGKESAMWCAVSRAENGRWGAR